MVQKIKSALKSPVFWVALVIGAILAVAYSRVAKAVAPVAAKLPGAGS